MTREGFSVRCPDEQHRGRRARHRAGDPRRERSPSWLALPLDRPRRTAGDLPAGDGGRDRPDRPPLLAGLDLRLDRRPDAGPLDRRRAAHRQAPDQGLAADHRRAARLRPAAGHRRRQPLRHPLVLTGPRRQDARARAGADHPAPGRALHARPPPLLGLRRPSRSGSRTSSPRCWWPSGSGSTGTSGSTASRPASSCSPRWASSPTWSSRPRRPGSPATTATCPTPSASPTRW